MEEEEGALRARVSAIDDNYLVLNIVLVLNTHQIHQIRENCFNLNDHPKIPLSANMVFLDGIWDFSITW